MTNSQVELPFILFFAHLKTILVLELFIFPFVLVPRVNLSIKRTFLGSRYFYVKFHFVV